MFQFRNEKDCEKDCASGSATVKHSTSGVRKIHGGIRVYKIVILGDGGVGKSGET